MNRVEMSRRTLLKQSGMALTGWTLLNTVHVGAAPAVLAQADKESNIQPAQSDPMIAHKFTYWESNGQITRRVEIPA
jgi:hypothetical protein